MTRKRIIFLVGPTASGKTGISLVLAKKLNAEIISCDSMQIYKGMDILTSKPSRSARKKIPHHLVDFVPVEKDYNVSQFLRQARIRISRIIAKGKMPLFVGGTGLYMSMVIDGIFTLKPADKKIRARLEAQAKAKGSGFLYQRLKAVDPLAAEKIHPNDCKRIIRALEVFEACGKPITQMQKERRGLKDKYDILIFCLGLDRQVLYQRIDERVEKMFRQGLVKEVKRLPRLKLSRTAGYAIGVREVAGYLEGNYDLDTARELIKRNTRRYAKRQLTWFRRDKRIRWIPVDARDTPAKVSRRIIELIK